MGSFANYLEVELLDHVFGNAAYTPPATLYIGLSTTDPGEAGSLAGEPSGNGYARVAKTNNATNFPAASPGAQSIKSVGTPVEFPEASGNWGTITHFFVADAASGGNILAYGQMNLAKTATSGDVIYFKVGELNIKLN